MTAGAAVGGGTLRNDDNFTCLQHENCCQTAEDKNEKKKVQRGVAAAPSELETQAPQQLQAATWHQELSGDGVGEMGMC